MVYRAYIKADTLEDPEVLQNLTQRLATQGITSVFTDKDWKEIIDPAPVLYFRNPYLRYTDELQVIKYHHEHPETPYIAADGEIISVNNIATGPNSFRANRRITYYKPAISPLPILMGTHQRPLYLKLTLNSLLYSIRAIPEQKIYIVMSQPDEETKKIVTETLKEYPQVEAVLSEENLRYAFANFGSKFYNLQKFIHHEDDGILPQNLEYFIPFWTQQLHHRHNTANLVTFRIFEGNWTTTFHKSEFLARSEQIQIPNKILWHYSKPTFKTIVPIGGMGMVIDSETMYKDFKPPSYNNSDHGVYFSSKIICIVNIPIYHIGANYEVDYPTYAAKKQNTAVNPLQKGMDLRSGVSRTIDLTTDWAKRSKN